MQLRTRTPTTSPLRLLLFGRKFQQPHGFSHTKMRMCLVRGGQVCFFGPLSARAKDEIFVSVRLRKIGVACGGFVLHGSCAACGPTTAAAVERCCKLLSCSRRASERVWRYAIVYCTRRTPTISGVTTSTSMKAPFFFRESKHRSVLVIGLDNAGIAVL